GVKTDFVKAWGGESPKLTKIPDAYAKAGTNASGTAPFALEPKCDVSGSGARFAFDYKEPDTAIAINRLLKDGGHVAFDAPSHVSVTGVARGKVEAVAKDFGLNVHAGDANSRSKAAAGTAMAFHAPRVAMYQPWTGG